jgi:hypothetical protein
VRSFYFLGQLAEQSGDHEAARRYYTKFAQHWKNGDMDRARVAEAQRKSAGGGQ